MDPERSETRLRTGEPLPPPVEGDAMFPAIDLAQWHEVARQDYAAGPDDEAPFTTLTYERRCE
jgi:dihydrofolate reductase